MAYIKVHDWMAEDLKLSNNELLVFALIYGFTTEGNGKYTGSLNYTAKVTGATKKTVCNSLNKLAEKGLIEREEIDVNNIKNTSYKSKDVVKKLHMGSEKITQGVVKKLHMGSEKITPNKINDKSNKYNNYKRKNSFNNFEQRTYNFADYERKLLAKEE